MSTIATSQAVTTRPYGTESVSATPFSSQTPTQALTTPVFSARHEHYEPNEQSPSLFDNFVGFMDKTLVRYIGYFNEIAASIGHSFFPEKHFDSNKWYKAEYPSWFKFLNGATWVYAGADVLAKAGEAYKKAQSDGDPGTNPTSMWAKTALDRSIFQTMATIVIPVKIIEMLQKGIEKVGHGKLSAKGLRNAKFFGSMLPIPLIAAFVDGGTNLLLDKTLRPMLGLPKHVVETHGKPLHEVVGAELGEHFLAAAPITEGARTDSQPTPTMTFTPAATTPASQAITQANPFISGGSYTGGARQQLVNNKFNSFVQ